MFDNLKKLHELKKMQDEFKREKLTFEDRGVSITMNGNFEVEEIKLNPELSIEDQQEVVKQCLNKVREDIQKTLAKKMMASGIGF
ncbi:MAG: YbaB/EbfC family DNA-binding protein [Candidatus Staskawiczbacteria bacterium]|nr:YbaB/EbfC family DNA-binding protein [Candidatus Staskawiczbacteria bacterium]